MLPIDQMILYLEKEIENFEKLSASAYREEAILEFDHKKYALKSALLFAEKIKKRGE